MAGSFGAETMQGERYRLSFTVGGLLAQQGRILAGMYLKHVENGEDGRFPRSEVGESIATIRPQAIEENVLAVRTVSANKRIVAETTKRLSALTFEELAYLGGSVSSAADRETLMWVAMCRYYAIVGEFANEVLKERYLVGNMHLDFEDYGRFIANKTAWHPELEALSDGTAKKLRSNLFKAMGEAHVLDKSNDTIIPSMINCSLADILVKRPDSFGFLPMRESSL